MSAASLATSVADSTEIPTSAACSATASLTPSPRNTTSRSAARFARISRAFCSGLTRAKIVVWSTCSRSASSSRTAISAPVETPFTSSPSSRQTFSATTALSPVATLTVIPSPARRSSDAAASSLG